MSSETLSCFTPFFSTALLSFKHECKLVYKAYCFSKRFSNGNNLGLWFTKVFQVSETMYDM